MTAVPLDQTLNLWLSTLLQERGAVAGTIHRVPADQREAQAPDRVELVAAVNIPEAVCRATQTVAYGKGMAGLALARCRPVSTCNLKEDKTGDVRPGAKAVDARAAVALPVRGAAGRIRAVVGIAYADDRTLDDATLAALEAAAASLPDD